jgi:threonylcarbamoyladenosine tRNA methylthiotransferase MtaB
VNFPLPADGGVSRPAGAAGTTLFRLADLCAALLRDVPDMKRLRLSSIDPAVDLRPLVNLMARDSRMLPHAHLSMQSGSDRVLARMGRRHNAQTVRDWVAYAQRHLPADRVDPVTFGWDIICGFPGETLELFDETCALIRELKPIRVHAFPFSPRPGTAAAAMPDGVSRAESKRRVKIVSALVRENRLAFMRSKVGRVVSVLTEEYNSARDPDDLVVKIVGRDIPAKRIVDVRLDSIAAEAAEEVFYGADAQTAI